jgi:hypothetical protein
MKPACQGSLGGCNGVVSISRERLRQVLAWDSHFSFKGGD